MPDEVLQVEAEVEVGVTGEEGGGAFRADQVTRGRLNFCLSVESWQFVPRTSALLSYAATARLRHCGCCMQSASVSM